jgi:hypothetical protein
MEGETDRSGRGKRHAAASSVSTSLLSAGGGPLARRSASLAAAASPFFSLFILSAGVPSLPLNARVHRGSLVSGACARCFWSVRSSGSRLLAMFCLCANGGSGDRVTQPPQCFTSNGRHRPLGGPPVGKRSSNTISRWCIQLDGAMSRTPLAMCLCCMLMELHVHFFS